MTLTLRPDDEQQGLIDYAIGASKEKTASKAIWWIINRHKAGAETEKEGGPLTVGIEKHELTLLLGVLFDAGVSVDSAIVQDPISTTWFLWFEACKNKYVLKPQRGSVREFKTLDAAYKEMASMGIQNTKIEKARIDAYRY